MAASHARSTRMRSVVISGLCICLFDTPCLCEPCKNGWTDRVDVQDVDSGGSNKPCIKWRPDPRTGSDTLWRKRGNKYPACSDLPVVNFIRRRAAAMRPLATHTVTTGYYCSYSMHVVMHRPVGRKWNGGVFCKRSGNGGCFVKKSGKWGVFFAYASNAPPAYGPDTLIPDVVSYSVTLKE